HSFNGLIGWLFDEDVSSAVDCCVNKMCSSLCASGPECTVPVPSPGSFWMLPSIKPSAQSLGRASHPALVHSGLMWVVGGYSFNYSNYHMMLNYNPDSSAWDVVPASSGPFYRYGHSLALYQDCIYMFDGKLETGPANITDELWLFNIPTRSWLPQKPASAPLYALEGHTAHVVILPNGNPVMLVFFSYSPIYSYINKVQEYNINKNTWLSPPTQYFFRERNTFFLLLYCLLTCDKWTVLPRPGLHRDVNHFGHSAVVSKGTMYVFGGFSGVLLNDVLAYYPPSCQAFLSPTLCLAAGSGVRCLWVKSRCLPWESKQYDHIVPASFCPARPGRSTLLTQHPGLPWCEDRKCISASSNCTVVNSSRCKRREEKECFQLANCRSCSLNNNSQWEVQQQECQLCGDGWYHVEDVCLRINSSRESYDDTQHYCKNLGGNIATLLTDNQVGFVLDELYKYLVKCLSSFYVGVLKYWNLMETKRVGTSTSLNWLLLEPVLKGSCLSSAWDNMVMTSELLMKRGVVTLKHLPELVGTEMDDVVSLTRRLEIHSLQTVGIMLNCLGLRTCAKCLNRVKYGWCGDLSNTGRGVTRSGSRLLDRDMVCPGDRCVNSSVCEHCGNLTAGTHCQTCIPGYYGDPTNGGKCNACNCNNHTNLCHISSGKCFCTTKGVKGDQCQLCDSESRYLGNPLRGTCYCKYNNLLIDYQFTFSLLQEDDRHYTAINFMATPEQANKNLDMSINASNNFNLNIWSFSSIAGTISGEEMSVIARMKIKEYRDSFSCEKFNFRLHHNITFYVYVSNFSWPIKIQIAFSHHNSIMDMVQFFVTFFSCFLLLLLVAVVVWKIKQTCWTSRRREQLMRERQQMASRPFASVDVVLEVGGDQEELQQVRARLQTVAHSPPGIRWIQESITIASALVDTPQQRVVDSKERGLGLKHHKHIVHHQGTCV
uniref:Attractin-like 1a n=1 Tax=Poecilia reticulata TaxID=8081 RepID=A0A3P9NJK9_POERE